MTLHPDDIVLVFTKDDVKTVLEEGHYKISLPWACKLISRNFDCTDAFAQMAEILELAESELEDEDDNDA
jgi:hypothetical protein